MYLVSGSLSGIWLNTQQVRGLALAWSCSRSTNSDNNGGNNDSGDDGGDDDSGDSDSDNDKGVEYSEKEP